MKADPKSNFFCPLIQEILETEIQFQHSKIFQNLTQKQPSEVFYKEILLEESILFLFKIKPLRKSVPLC